MQLRQKLNLFYITSIFSMLIAVLGFSYNTWRLELSEDNNTMRTAAFEVLLQLAEFEQIVFAAHYDQNTQEGNPRKAWVKVGLIESLSVLIGSSVESEAIKLTEIWSENWQHMSAEEASTKLIIKQVDAVRKSIKKALTHLK